MAGYLRQKLKRSTSSKYSCELQENRKHIPGTTNTTSDNADSIADRARFLQNPAILDTLDSVHRSLLFNNLKFDTDEHTCLDGSTLPDNHTRRKEELLESATALSAAYTREPSPKQTLDKEEESRDDETSLESLPGKTPIVNEPLIVRERVEDRLTFRKEVERFQKNSSASTSYRGRREDLFAFEKDIIVEEEMGGKNVKANVESGAGARLGQNLNVLKAHKSVQVKVGGNGAAPLGCFDTDSEIDSLRRYDDGEIEELVHSLHDNVTLSDIGTLETETTASSSMGNDLDTIGYDTVDLAPPVSRVFHQPPIKNLTIDTVDVSELISHAPDDSLSTVNRSPVTNSPLSAKLSTSSTTVMRNLKDKLRTSFRKSKSFIRNEKQRR